MPQPNPEQIRKCLEANHGGAVDWTDGECLQVWHSLTAVTQIKYLAKAGLLPQEKTDAPSL